MRHLAYASILAFGLSLGVASVAVAAEKTLYDRLGGLEAIKAVVGQFVANNSADPEIGPRWQSSDVEELKEYLVELLCEATGGPCTYTGQSMVVAHTGLNITDREFARVAANLTSALTTFNVGDAEQRDLLTIVASLKGQVVGK